MQLYYTHVKINVYIRAHTDLEHVHTFGGRVDLFCVFIFFLSLFSVSVSCSVLYVKCINNSQPLTLAQLSSAFLHEK